MESIESMSTLTFAKRGWQAAQEGRLSEIDLNELMQAICLTHFGNDMSKMLADPIGQVFLQPRTMRKSVSEELELLQKRPRSQQPRLTQAK